VTPLAIYRGWVVEHAKKMSNTVGP
jgi:hypothetical protein